MFFCCMYRNCCVIATAPTVNKTDSASRPITRALLKVLMLVVVTRSPFKTFAGLNADRTNAGYNPATTLTDIADKRIKSMNAGLVHGMLRLRCARLLNKGRNNDV